MRTGKTGRFSRGPARWQIYEDASEGTSDDLRWFWSIRVYVWPDAGVITSGKAATLDQAKAEFQRNWIAWAKLREDV